MTEREQLIEYAESHMSDMVPHDDPNYWESLREMAEQYAYWVLEDPVRVGVCAPIEAAIVIDETPW